MYAPNWELVSTSIRLTGSSQ